MTLWALLFNLSQLTRYYPASWAAVRNPDESPIAVAIEHALEVALELMPRLVASALHGPIPALVAQAAREAAPSSTPAAPQVRRMTPASELRCLTRHH